jgi:hypothetical protein
MNRDDDLVEASPFDDTPQECERELHGLDLGESVECLLRPYVTRPFSMIPRRAWLHGAHYIRGQVVMTVAPGGYGKTSLILCNAMEMVTGRGLIGPAPPTGPLRVAFWNAEDPDEEIERRIAAICTKHNVDPALLQDRFYLGSRLANKRRVASVGKNGEIVLDLELLQIIEQNITDQCLDVVIFDPLVAFHSVPESNNTAMEQIIKDGFGEIATRTNCCIELSQHTRKWSQGRTSELTADDSRGAGAIVNAARSVRVLNRMTAEEAKLPGITEENRRQYIRVARDKTNLAPPGKAMWVHLVSVGLPNGDDVLPGDQVQAVESWKYPNPFEDISVADMQWVRREVQVKSYRKDSRSPDWLGLALAKRLKLNPEGKTDRAKINAILSMWVRNGVLAVEKRKDDNRHERQYYVAGSWNEDATPAPVKDTD